MISTADYPFFSGGVERSGLKYGYPTRKMLFEKYPPVLTENKINGSYKNVDEYLDIHTKLVLEDFMYPLREALKEFRNNPRCKFFNGARVYRNIELRLAQPYRKIRGSSERFYNRAARTYILSNIRCLTIQSKDGETEPSFGRLLLFTESNFEDLILGKVISDKPGHIEIEVQPDIRDEVEGIYTMMQTDAFYYKYEHILRVLDSLNEENFPLKEHIVYGCKTSQRPAYLEESTVYNVFGASIPMTTKWPEVQSSNMNLFENMDLSQYSAMESALTSKIAVIQGPPGTGKTFFGVRMVKVLLDNIHFWNPTGSTPLLVVCHSNQALDHFLEGLLEYTGNLVRVGEQCQSEELKDFLLHEKVRHCSRTLMKNVLIRKVLQTADVVGMTTTGAAARTDYLNQIKSPIVIVEEAAEVLESDVIASMTKYCQHLILLGDHKQLKPILTTHHLGPSYNLNVSLFERLLKNQIVNLSCLTTQYRMRPDISSLLKPHIYQHLDDHQSTLEKAPIRGILKSVFFLHHDETEETVNNKHGFFNPHEVQMLISLANYFVSVGYSSSEITIIAMYLQQRNKLKKECKNYPALKDLEIASVDSFQGKENEIILLSLVRNNTGGNIGFLEEETRACVALSRARKGLFIMGNENCLKKKISTVWAHVLQRLREQNAVGTELTLFCQAHDAFINVSKKEHWNEVWCIRCHQKRQIHNELLSRVTKETLILKHVVSQPKSGNKSSLLKPTIRKQVVPQPKNENESSLLEQIIRKQVVPQPKNENESSLLEQIIRKQVVPQPKNENESSLLEQIIRKQVVPQPKNENESSLLEQIIRTEVVSQPKSENETSLLEPTIRKEVVPQPKSGNELSLFQTAIRKLVVSQPKTGNESSLLEMLIRKEMRYLNLRAGSKN